MKKILIALMCLFPLGAFAQRLKLKQIMKAPGADYIVVTDQNGDQTYTPLTGLSMLDTDTRYDNPRIVGSVLFFDLLNIKTNAVIGQQSVDLSSLALAPQTLSLSNSDLSISSGNTIDLCPGVRYCIETGDIYTTVEVDNSTNQITFTYPDGGQVIWNETPDVVTTLSYNVTTRRLEYVNENQIVNSIELPDWGDMSVSEILSSGDTIGYEITHLSSSGNPKKDSIILPRPESIAFPDDGDLALTELIMDGDTVAYRIAHTSSNGNVEADTLVLPTPDPIVFPDDGSIDVQEITMAGDTVAYKLTHVSSNGDLMVDTLRLPNQKTMCCDPVDLVNELGVDPAELRDMDVVNDAVDSYLFQNPDCPKDLLFFANVEAYRYCTYSLQHEYFRATSTIEKVLYLDTEGNWSLLGDLPGIGVEQTEQNEIAIEAAIANIFITAGVPYEYIDYSFKNSRYTVVSPLEIAISGVFFIDNPPSNGFYSLPLDEEECPGDTPSGAYVYEAGCNGGAVNIESPECCPPFDLTQGYNGVYVLDVTNESQVSDLVFEYLSDNPECQEMYFYGANTCMYDEVQKLNNSTFTSTNVNDYYIGQTINLYVTPTGSGAIVEEVVISNIAGASIFFSPSVTQAFNYTCDPLGIKFPETYVYEFFCDGVFLSGLTPYTDEQPNPVIEFKGREISPQGGRGGGYELEHVFLNGDIQKDTIMHEKCCSPVNMTFPFDSYPAVSFISTSEEIDDYVKNYLAYSNCPVGTTFFIEQADVKYVYESTCDSTAFITAKNMEHMHYGGLEINEVIQEADTIGYSLIHTRSSSEKDTVNILLPEQLRKPIPISYFEDRPDEVFTGSQLPELECDVMGSTVITHYQNGLVFYNCDGTEWEYAFSLIIFFNLGN